MKKRKGYADDDMSRSIKEHLTIDSVFSRREFETFVKQTNFPGLIADRFCENQYVGEGSEELIRLAKEYLSANLSEAMYIVAGLTLLKAHLYATGELLLKPRVDALHAEAIKQIQRRDTKLVVRSGKGAHLKWDAKELSALVQRTLRDFNNPQAVSLPNVVRAINQSYPSVRLTTESLKRLLARKGVNWKELKESRIKEIKKGT